jgi:hypothetical protein
LVQSDKVASPGAGCAPLLAAQNPDGGWGYQGGSSWTEPAAYALLALGGQPDAAPAIDRARRWLAANQRADGGFAPRPSVEESTWVTALALLAGAVSGDAARRAVEWLLGKHGEESTFIYRLRQWMNSERPAAIGEGLPGWSWYPGTAAWVVPTSLTILALAKIERRYPDPRIHQRIEEGRRFLLTRVCEDGGWNHGSIRALGFQAVSYPETTGIALVALHGADPARLSRSVAKAEEHFRNCRSLEGLSWLQLGLMAQGRPAPALPADIRPRTLLDTALAILAARARDGRNVFLEAAV